MTITNVGMVIASNPWNTYIQEICDGFNVEWEQRIATWPIRVLDGYIAIPERPGLGLTLDLKEIARHPYQQAVYPRSSARRGSGVTLMWRPRRAEAS